MTPQEIRYAFWRHSDGPNKPGLYQVRYSPADKAAVREAFDQGGSLPDGLPDPLIVLWTVEDPSVPAGEPRFLRA